MYVCLLNLVNRKTARPNELLYLVLLPLGQMNRPPRLEGVKLVRRMCTKPSDTQQILDMVTWEVGT